LKKRVWQTALPYCMLLPALIIIIIFKMIPIIQVMVTSFIDNGEFSFRTYQILFEDKAFWLSLWTTIKMNVVMIPLQIVISFLLALLVHQKLRGIGIFRSIFYLPVTLAISVASITWALMANYNSGVFNSIFSFLGIDRQGLFTDAKQALWCIVIMATWKGCGYWMMYILAGLKGVDEGVYESAKLDGAGPMRTLISITLPLIKRSMLFVVVANTAANMLLFAPMKLITEGGPQSSTNVLMYEVYKSAFRNGNASRAGAITTILLVIVLSVVVLQFKMLNEKES
jgi:ABC-type sugar transport systems, permease components